MSRTNDELEAAIARDPDDDEIRRVYADALQERGDPRGEHIAVAFLADRGDADAAARLRAIEREAGVRLAAALDKKYVVRFRWRLGFVEHVEIASRNKRDDDRLPRAKLRALIEQRELAPLRALDLRGVWNSEWSVSKMIGSLPDLVAGRPVRWLGIGDGPIDDTHVASLRAAMPRLDGLGVITTKPRALLPALRPFKDVDFATRKQDSRRLVRALPGALAPDLQRLVLHGMDDEIEAKTFEGILARDVFPQLRHLGVMGPPALTIELLKAASQSKLWPQLATFGMCCDELWDDDENEAWIRQHPEVFAHLKLFTSKLWPDEEDGHEACRLGLVLKAIDRAAEAVPELEYHLQFFGEDSDHYSCWEVLGDAMWHAGWPLEALGPLDRALEKFEHECDYDSIETFRTKAGVLESLGRRDEALELIAKAIDYDSDDSRTHRIHGCLLRDLGRFPEAMMAFDKAIQNAADQNEMHRPALLGWAYIARGRTLWQMRRIPDALRAFDNARKRGDATAVCAAWSDQGAVELQRGRLAEARAALAQATETKLDAHALYELGVVEYMLGDYEAALATWRKGAATDIWLDQDEQAYALLALGRPAEALAATESARREHGAGRAFALHALGRTPEAIAAVEDLGHRAGLSEPVCAYRHLVAPLIQAALLRATGREDDAADLFAKARRPPLDPHALHAALVAELGAAPGCDKDLCGRSAAAVAIAAALAVGDLDDARARARMLGAVIDTGSARLVTSRIWEVHQLLPMLGVDASLAVAALEAVERADGGRELIRSAS